MEVLHDILIKKKKETKVKYSWLDLNSKADFQVKKKKKITHSGVQSHKSV